MVIRLAILPHWFSLSVVFVVHLGYYTQSFIPLHLEVRLFRLLDLVVYSVNLELVRLHLGLVVLQLGDHFLQLLAPFLQVLLVHHQFFSDFFATLLGEDVLQLDVQLLFLLNENILLRNLLCLCNKSLLQRLDLLDEFIRLNVGRL